MRLALLALAIALAAPTAAAPRQQLDTLSPAEAISRATASTKPLRAVFQLKVESAAKSRGGYYLDSEKDYRSPKNLGIRIRPSAMPRLTDKYGADLKSAFVGKTLKIIGQVRRVTVGKGSATATEVDVTHAGQILSVS